MSTIVEESPAAALARWELRRDELWGEEAEGLIDAARQMCAAKGEQYLSVDVSVESGTDDGRATIAFEALEPMEFRANDPLDIRRSALTENADLVCTVSYRSGRREREEEKEGRFGGPRWDYEDIVEVVRIEGRWHLVRRASFVTPDRYEHVDALHRGGGRLVFAASVPPRVRRMEEVHGAEGHIDRWREDALSAAAAVLRSVLRDALRGRDRAHRNGDLAMIFSHAEDVAAEVDRARRAHPEIEDWELVELLTEAGEARDGFKTHTVWDRWNAGQCLAVAYHLDRGVLGEPETRRELRRLWGRAAGEAA